MFHRCFSLFTGSYFPSHYFGAKDDWGEIVNTAVLMSDTHLVIPQWTMIFYVSYFDMWNFFVFFVAILVHVIVENSIHFVFHSNKLRNFMVMNVSIINYLNSYLLSESVQK